MVLTFFYLKKYIDLLLFVFSLTTGDALSLFLSHNDDAGIHGPRHGFPRCDAVSLVGNWVREKALGPRRSGRTLRGRRRDRQRRLTANPAT